MVHANDAFDAPQHELSTDSEITKCLVKNTAAPRYG
jgi:hypothetical protein